MVVALVTFFPGQGLGDQASTVIFINEIAIGTLQNQAFGEAQKILQRVIGVSDFSPLNDRKSKRQCIEKRAVGSRLNGRHRRHIRDSDRIDASRREIAIAPKDEGQGVSKRGRRYMPG